MHKKITCKTGLKKNVISKNVFEREIALCQKLNNEGDSKGCNWGKCTNCGVIPLLIKLYGGVLIEDKKELKEVKKEIFN
ncbi:MAG TPA: hypothetical protein DDY52_00580 [Candidatus Moranbacteria bacterium]|nr:MAG: hypothetical protein UR51_C0006G0075 [Candidatus Moranbacteria bacterium GW2011_GWF1_34_10]HBI16644.1 hypothetical protein [Candidatus Moranbacteria bacterium]